MIQETYSYYKEIKFSTYNQNSPTRLSGTFGGEIGQLENKEERYT